jgi:DNA repair exonuclease SbcCD ATPase subunit
MDAAGGGAVDVAAFALRVASWSMQRPRTRPVIILDEPMRFLSPDLQPKASDMLQELSQKLGLQFIIVTHEEELTQQVDKVFEVLKKGGVTNVRTS